MKPIASVVIPAHNESAVIGRLLCELAPLAATGELCVHVVCNGCVDDTAVVASEYSGVCVHELATPSKIAALNAGDVYAGDVWPRLYIDADVVVDANTVVALVEALEGEGILAAAPAAQFVTAQSPRSVQDYYDVYLQLPWAREQIIGRGIYALSQEGRARFGDFPDLLNDDLFVGKLYSAEERCSVASGVVRIEAPRTWGALVKTKARARVGTLEYLTRYPPQNGTGGEGGSERSLAGRVRGLVGRVGKSSRDYLGIAVQPGGVRKLLNYTCVRVGARIVAAGYWGDRNTVWAQDRTTR